MGWEGERSLTAHFAGSRLCHSRFTPVPYVPFPSHPVPSRLGPFPSVPYPGPDGTGRDEMGRECSDNQIITIIVQFFPAVTNDFLFHSPHVLWQSKDPAAFLLASCSFCAQGCGPLQSHLILQCNVFLNSRPLIMTLIMTTMRHLGIHFPSRWNFQIG